MDYGCTTLHGDRTQPEREKAISDFKHERYNILVATDIAARGLDIPNVNCVINFDTPNNIEDYVHRIGRTGRIGKKGIAMSFINEKNKPVVKELYSLLYECNQEIPEWFEDFYNSLVIKKPKAKRIYRNFN
jgi:ATP-dependent RNA helicase DDX3X